MSKIVVFVFVQVKFLGNINMHVEFQMFKNMFVC
jgi:hypothetical protein